MYPEFIAIYVMLAIVIVMLFGIIILLFLLLKKHAESVGTSGQSANSAYYSQPYQQSYNDQYSSNNVVFCNHCATQYDSSQAYCPRCGAKR